MIKLVIIEDQDEILKLILEILKLDPTIEVIATFRDSYSAINNMENLQPDIVLTDIGLPDISGIECIKILKPRFPNIDFMVWSVFNDQSNVIEALKNGANSYVLKTDTPNFILQSIQELAEGKSPLSPEIARVLINNFFQPIQQKNNSFSNITSRELQVLEMLSKGFLYKEIASDMNISVNTLKTHCYNIYKKLHVSNKTEAINLLKNN